LMPAAVGSKFPCYAENACPYLFTGTKTGYLAVLNDDTAAVEHEGCETAHSVWFLARHGTRYPSAMAMGPMRKQLPKIRDQVVGNHKVGRGDLCDRDLNNLVEWKFNLTSDDELLLTESGMEEMKGLGKRWRKRLQNLVDKMLINNNTFGFTDTQRTKESARQFEEGLLNTTDVCMRLPVSNTDLLHFYKTCEKYKEAIFQKRKSEKEVKKLFRSYNLPSLKLVVENVNKRLGYHNKTVSLKAVELMWDMCRWEMSWWKSDWAWCAIFTRQEMKLFEDNEDLFFHYQDGYAYNITREMTGVLLSDLLSKLKEDNGGDNNRFYFAHSETFLPFLARLGIARDDPPLSVDNLPEDRNWKTSLIGGESSNLAVVGMRCGGENKIKFYLNERVINVDGCKDSLCDAAEFRAKFEKLAFHNLRTVCKT